MPEEEEWQGHPAINYQGRRPLYLQVADLIDERVRRGELAVDSKLPSERDLRDLYRVAYSTIRRAMEELRERGTVETVHGRGTYVVKTPPPKE
ncbi:GntR family transcriptional regulator [Actinoallomurus sp. CA-142502]|uniref:GntR family transcriptional regulator n=1 Tax=Actinoallomurus sp. CA-142502 TaxID=3239885 RepID=UPI003D8E95D7